MNSRIEELYQIIKDTQVEIESIRKECKHEHQSEGLYSWRVGCMDWHMICNDCGYIGKYVKPWQSPHSISWKTHVPVIEKEIEPTEIKNGIV